MRFTPSLFRVLPVSAALLLGCEGTKLVEPTIPAEGSLAAIASGRDVAAPSNASAAAKSETQIDVSWQDNSGNETKFEVHRSVNGETGTFDLRATLGVDVGAFSDQSLQVGTQYCYKIRAVRVSGLKVSYSEFSNAACATTLTPPPPPPPPPPPAPSAASGAIASPLSSSDVHVIWLDNSTSEDGFRIERSTDGGANWSSAGTLPRDTYSFDDSGLQSEQQACYRVVAFNAGGDAAPSNTACTIPPAAPTNFVGTLVDAESGTLNLTWNDNSAVEEHYQVWGSYRYYPPCPEVGACDAGYYEFDGMLAELPANSTAYRCEGCASYYQFYVLAVKDGGRSDVTYWYAGP
jgi:hypothetical protein